MKLIITELKYGVKYHIRKPNHKPFIIFRMENNWVKVLTMGIEILINPEKIGFIKKHRNGNFSCDIELPQNILFYFFELINEGGDYE